ncbi:ABC transporter permease [Dictyobacter aurantiacus]|uniref:Polysaccharide ABC transporter ATP-binding protein n=1 Tax=Dictyobacter aurantiacus TaxID=1936993 RepID=A0A401ZT24_9CHLR|nr:ABC transporter permease subunit [Dictyobacter aurantiacus]GCE10017.1 polysaccharide ABC transporter ATP-binding protein [Dictyobacter aurantiacus]
MTKRFTVQAQAQIAVGETAIGQTADLEQEQSQEKEKQQYSKRTILWHRVWRERWVYFLVLPGIIYFIIFYYLPLLGNVAAFQDYSPYLGFFRSPWVGLDNFKDIFTDPDTLVVVRNTLVISLLQIIFAFPAAIILALLLNAIANERFKRFMQSLVYLPHFLGWVIIISIWQQLFGGDGLVNQLVKGMGGKEIDLLTNPDLFKPMIVLQVMWKESGWGTIMFLAAITSINLALYESAAVDGANRWQRLWHITLPGIRSIIMLLLILRLGNVLSIGFEQVFLQRGGMSLDAAEVIDTFVYNRGIVSGQWGFAAAVALLKVVIGIVLIYTANRAARKFGEEGLY